MPTTAELHSMLLALPAKARASMAVDLIDSLGDEASTDDDLAMLADERDAEMESGAVQALSYDQFIAGLRRPSLNA